MTKISKKNCIPVFGGVIHGQTIPDDGNVRYEYALQQPVRYVKDVLCLSSFETQTYYIRTFAECYSCPHRIRKMKAAILEGAELTKREQWEVEKTLYKVPWDIRSASILEDFEQWFSRVVYKYTGKLVWHDRIM